MTEEVKPRGSPYGLAMAVLQEYSDSLPGAIVLLPDHVLWPCTSAELNTHNFQLLEEASAVLSALAARHIPLALLLPDSSSKLVESCLHLASLQSHFAAVVEYNSGSTDIPTTQQPQQQQQGTNHHHQQQPQRRAAPAAAVSSSWMEAAAALKAQTGTAWQQMLVFSSEGAPEAARLASKLGMACAEIPVASSGLTVDCLRAGLEAYSMKLEGDRGF